MNILLLSLLLLICPVTVAAQKPPEACVPNRNSPPISSYYWRPDTNVKVYFRQGMFTNEQKESMFEAIDVWSEVALETGAGVKFTYVGETDEIEKCHDCLTVSRREVYKNDRKNYAFFNPLKQDPAGLLLSAWIDFDFATTNPQALQGFMAHELGHGMGLWDCKQCEKKTTIMNAFPGINKDNGLVIPSPCDRELVRLVYTLHRLLKS